MNQDLALEILGLNPDFSPVELKHAYREQVRLWHPDRYSNGSSLKKVAETHIPDANLAYAFLKRSIPSGVSERPRCRPAPSKPGCAGKRGPGESNHGDKLRRWAARLYRHFPKIDLKGLLAWLRRDGQKHFRPWYRYPDAAEPAAAGQRDAAPNFGQILDRTLQRSGGLKRLRHKSPAEPSTEETDTVAPVTGVSSARPIKRQ